MEIGGYRALGEPSRASLGMSRGYRLPTMSGWATESQLERRWENAGRVPGGWGDNNNSELEG